MTDTQNDPLDITSSSMHPSASPQSNQPNLNQEQNIDPNQSLANTSPAAINQATSASTPIENLVAQPPVAAQMPVPTQSVAAPVMGSAIPQIPQAQISQNNPFGNSSKQPKELTQVHTGGSGKTLLTFLVLFVFFTLIGFGSYFAYNNLNNGDSDADTLQNLDQTPMVSSPVSLEPSLNITTPLDGQSVGESITVEGDVEDISSFMVSLFSLDNTLLDRVTLTPTTNTWSTLLSFVNDQEYDSGYILVTSTDEQVEYAKINLVFTSIIETERIRITSLSRNQVITQNEVELTGEMTGFFEGAANVRLLDENENVILEDYFNAESENYESFAPFSKTLTIPEVYFVDGKVVTVEIYEISSKDGSETSIVSFDLEIDTAEI